MDLSPEVLQAVVGKLIILILSIAVHEFGHAYVADRLGDRLPRQQGRVTLNPFAHADPIGTLALPIFGLLASHGTSTGFGWGKPVMTQPNSYTRRFHMRTGHMMVAFAGPAMNFLFGTFIAFLVVVLVKTGVFHLTSFYQSTSLPSMMVAAAWTNYVLMFFNLLPARPLDGGAVLEGLLPYRWLPAYKEYEKYGIFVAAAFIMIPTLSIAFRWPAEQLLNLVMSLIGLHFGGV
jgi:Zn-dependent protease